MSYPFACCEAAAPGYLPPLVEVVLVEVESGFAASPAGGSTPDMDIEELPTDLF